MTFENSIAFARKLDHQDTLKSFRSKFLLPKVKEKTTKTLAQAYAGRTREAAPSRAVRDMGLAYKSGNGASSASA